MNKLLIISFLTFISFTAKTQVNLDSLWQVWKAPTQADSNKLKAMKQISWDGYLFTQPDSAFYFAQIQYDYAQDKNLKKYMAVALNTQGVSFAIRGNHEEALNYYSKSLHLYEELEYKKGIASSMNNIGTLYSTLGDNISALDYKSKSLKIYTELEDKDGMLAVLSSLGHIYEFQGNYIKSLEYYTQCLKISEELSDKKGMSSSLNDIGVLFSIQKEYQKAIDYFSQSLSIDEELGNLSGLSSTFNNLGALYADLGEYDKALDYHFKSLEIDEERGAIRSVAISLNNIGATYKDLGNETKALEYYIKSLKMQEEHGLKSDMISTYINIGYFYKDQGEFSKSIINGKKALAIAQELNAILEIKNAAELLWVINKKLGKNKEALLMHELYIQMRDSIESEENQKAVIQQQYKYEYDKKAAADSIKAMEEAKVQEALLTAEKAETEKQKAQVKQQEQQKYYLFGGLALALLFGGFIYNRFRITSKQKNIIEAQKQLVEQQKQIVEESHKEITDSINYAERIQRSFLATKEILDTNLKDYFVFFKPKEAVSGDFYWAAELRDGNFAWSVADSTGHGVPGAIMSLLNISSLEKAIETETSPEKILFKTREIIITRLKKDGSSDGGKDGMDCNLLAINKERTILTFASANNPVIIIRNNEILEFKGDKIPVGKHDKDSESFSLQTLELQKGDIIYALTDGFPDQFGGKKGKKYMIKNLKNKLLEISSFPMVQQRDLLEKEFKNWKNNTEQIDDVCIMGVRI